METQKKQSANRKATDTPAVGSTVSSSGQRQVKLTSTLAYVHQNDTDRSTDPTADNPDDDDRKSD